MSELNEINEDNCVLDFMDMHVIEIAFNTAAIHSEIDWLDIKGFSTSLSILFLKINKLNERAKKGV